MSGSEALDEARERSWRRWMDENAGNNAAGDWLVEDAFKAAWDEQAATIQSMREALEKIAAHDDSYSIPHSWPACGKPLVEIAREVLASMKDTTPGEG